MMPARFALLLFALVACPAADADPFQSRDQNPLLGGFGVPAPLPARLDGEGATDIQLVANWSNTTNADVEGSDILLVDAESRELRLIGTWTFSPFAIRVQLPHRRYNAGILDDFIDAWHSALGLPDGARDELPSGNFRIAYLRGNARWLDLRSPRHGIGDIAIEGGYQWQRSERGALAAWLSIEAPTGDDEQLTGNDGWDTALTLTGERRYGSKTTVYGQVSVVHLADFAALNAAQTEWIFAGMVAVEYALLPRLAVLAQLDLHESAFPESPADFLRDPVILTIGGEYRFADGWRFGLGIGEDIAVGRSPDVNFNFTIGKQW